MQEAAAQGDRSENAEYIYGKKMLREIDARVRFLRKRLEGLVVVSRPPDDRSRIYFGAWVQDRGRGRPRDGVAHRRSRRDRSGAQVREHGFAARPRADEKAARRRGHGRGAGWNGHVRGDGDPVPGGVTGDWHRCVRIANVPLVSDHYRMVRRSTRRQSASPRWPSRRDFPSRRGPAARGPRSNRGSPASRGSRPASAWTRRSSGVPQRLQKLRVAGDEDRNRVSRVVAGLEHELRFVGTRPR